MAYIGRQLVRGQNRILDDISSSFNGSTTAFNLTVSSSSSPPASVNQLWIILGGVLQKPGTDFTVADAVITFTTAPASTLNFWGMIQGDTSDINSPADASVTPSKIANSGDFAFPADVRFNDADGSHYVGLQAPSTVSSNLVWTLPAADGSANQLLKTDGSGALGWASDTQSNLLDEDNMSSNSATQPASQQSIKAYADTKAVLTGSTNNTITTVTGAHAIQGEANLTFDGSVLHVVSSGNNTTLLVESTDADANVGPIIELFRNSSSPADNDVLGRIDFKGDDDAGNASSFARIAVTALDVSNGSEDARIDFIAATNDTFTSTMSIAGGKVGIGLDTGIQSRLHVQDVEGTTLTLGNTDAAASDGDYLSGIDFWIKDNNDSTGAATASIRTYADQNHTASAKGTALAFHTTDDDTTTLDERMRITQDGMCGIGTNSPSDLLTVSGSSGVPQITVENTSNSARESAINIKGKHSNGTVRQLMLKYDSNDTFRIHTAGSMHITVETNDTIHTRFHGGNANDRHLEVLSGNLVLASGHGIDFSATSGTGTSEILDDYEEGTWTPTDQSSAGLSFGGSGYIYTKIGRMVYARIEHLQFPVTSDTNSIYIGGLPFTVGAAHGSGGAPVSSSANGQKVLADNGTTKFWMYATASASGSTNASMTGQQLYGILLVYEAA